VKGDWNNPDRTVAVSYDGSYWQLNLERTLVTRGQFNLTGGFNHSRLSGDGATTVWPIHIINNQARMGEGRLKKMTAGLKAGDVVTKRELERVLLLINDLPGMEVKRTLAPGKTEGTTELTLNITDTDQYSGSAYADNHGNRFTGAARGGLSVGVQNLPIPATLGWFYPILRFTGADYKTAGGGGSGQKDRSR
jgi:hypothetical protein